MLVTHEEATFSEGSSLSVLASNPVLHRLRACYAHPFPFWKRVIMPRSRSLSQGTVVDVAPVIKPELGESGAAFSVDQYEWWGNWLCQVFCVCVTLSSGTIFFFDRG